MRVHDSRQSYSRCLAMRARMVDFHGDLGGRRGWALLAGVFFRRFELAFVRFLDAPTRLNLDDVLAFEAEMRDIDRRFAQPRPGKP